MLTIYSDYAIRSDGKIIIDPDKIASIIFKSNVHPSKIITLQENFDVIEFNKRSDVKIEVFDGEDVEISEQELEWNIPEDYKNIFLFDYIFKLYESKEQNKSIIRYQRVLDELTEIRNMNVEFLFKTIIYIIDEFRKKNIVWGVGRGSSCASYVLYLIGVHSVDPVKYNIDMSEFFHK